MQVLVFKVSKESHVVPDGRTAFETHGYIPKGPYVDIGREMLVDRHVWPIRKFSRYECEPSSFGMPRELQRGHRIDTYIAIDPELEKFVAIPYNEKIEAMAQKLNDEQARQMRLELQIENWWSMPWYKRVWSALRK